MGMTFAKPRAATLEDIQDIVAAFAHAAAYLESAGFDGIELHGAHGYLFAQFLALSTNKRTDAYGGSLRNRARLITDVAAAIRKATKPNFILSIKINSAEFQADGFQPEEARELVRILEENTFDFVELSGGTYEQLVFYHKRESTKKREAFFIEFADLIAPGLKKTKVYVTGGFKTVGAMISALGTVDGVGLDGRSRRSRTSVRTSCPGRFRVRSRRSWTRTASRLRTWRRGRRSGRWGRTRCRWI